MTPNQYADHLIARYEEMKKLVPGNSTRAIFTGAKASLLLGSSLSVPLRRSMLESYRIAEMKLFGQIDELPREEELLKEPLGPIDN
jgi:hypothetical protein